MSYIVDGKAYEIWSAKNQRIIDRLIGREVYCCMTSEVEYMLSTLNRDDNNPLLDLDWEECMYRKHCVECGSPDFTEKTAGELLDSDFKTNFGYIEEIEERGNGYECPVCGRAYQTIDGARECCREETVFKCDECGKIYNEQEHGDLDLEYEEVYEWWAVSGWLGDKLREQGCIVIDSWGKSYWGRQTTGQAISLDWCIANVAKELGILEGMGNEWLEY